MHKNYVEPPDHDRGLPFLLNPLSSSSTSVDNLGDCVSNRNASPLNLLLRKPRGDANLQSRLKLPSDILARCIDCSRHTLESSYQYAVCQRLQKLISSVSDTSVNLVLDLLHLRLPAKDVLDLLSPVSYWLSGPPLVSES